MKRLRIGYDTSLNNKGSLYKIGDELALELEQCVTIMKTLNWTYELVQYDNHIGYIQSNGTATGGLLGDVQRGELDMACGMFRMTPERVAALSFSYPAQLEVNQVYLMSDPRRSEDVGFLFRPFATHVWLMLAVTFFIVTSVFLLMRMVELWEDNESIITSVHQSVAHVISYSFNFDFRSSSKPKFFAFHLFSAIWIISWFHVFIDYYTSELSGMLIVSAKKQVPFTNFHGFIDSLRSGKYRLLTASADRIPECPQEISVETCYGLFAEILTKYPPKIGDLGFLNLESAKLENPPLVGFAWYPTQRIPSKISLWTQQVYHSDVWVIKDFSVCPAGYPVKKGFSQLNKLNSAIIGMIVAFETMDNHYTPAYPEVSLYAKPATSAFTLTELGSVFFVHFCICIVASGVMFVELFIGAYKKLSSENGNSAV